MQRVLNFNDRVEQVRRGNERELLAIEARRQRNLANSDSLRKDLQNAFAELKIPSKTGVLEFRQNTNAKPAFVRQI